MHRFVIRITLHVPLGTCIQNPQSRLKDLSRRNKLSTRATFGNVLFRKRMPDALPIQIAQPKSSNTYSPSAMTRNFEIGSNTFVVKRGAKIAPEQKANFV